MTTEELLAAINPANHEKYSPNLFKWFKRHKVWFEKGGPRCYRVNGVVYIGHVFDNDFCGSRLGDVLCFGARADTGSYGSPRYLALEGWEEDSDFWPEYVRLGRCSFDLDHQRSFKSAENRYTVEGDKRTCNWCGYEQVLQRREQIVVHTEWVAKS